MKYCNFYALLRPSWEVNEVSILQTRPPIITIDFTDPQNVEIDTKFVLLG